MAYDDDPTGADYDLCELLSHGGYTKEELLRYLIAMAESVLFQIREATKP